MNNFTSKKMGEVLAFSEVGEEIAGRAKKALNETFGSEFASEMSGKNKALVQEIIRIAEENKVGYPVKAKAMKTGAKLRKMQNLYLQTEDDWKDSAEIMEWLGFFEGAAVIHWSLVSGAAKSIGDESLSKTSKEGLDFHKNLMEKIEEAIYRYAEEKAEE